MQLVYYIIEINRNRFDDMDYYIKVLSEFNVVFASLINDICMAVCEDRSDLHILEQFFDRYPNEYMYVTHGPVGSYETRAQMCASIDSSINVINHCIEFGIDGF